MESNRGKNAARRPGEVGWQPHEKDVPENVTLTAKDPWSSGLVPYYYDAIRDEVTARFAETLGAKIAYTLKDDGCPDKSWVLIGGKAYGLEGEMQVNELPPVLIADVDGFTKDLNLAPLRDIHREAIDDSIRRLQGFDRGPLTEEELNRFEIEVILRVERAQASEPKDPEYDRYFFRRVPPYDINQIRREVSRDLNLPLPEPERRVPLDVD